MNRGTLANIKQRLLSLDEDLKPKPSSGNVETWEDDKKQRRAKIEEANDIIKTLVQNKVPLNVNDKVLGSILHSVELMVKTKHSGLIESFKSLWLSLADYWISGEQLITSYTKEVLARSIVSVPMLNSA